jgi:hypothetical protein
VGLAEKRVEQEKEIKDAAKDKVHIERELAEVQKATAQAGMSADEKRLDNLKRHHATAEQLAEVAAGMKAFFCTCCMVPSNPFVFFAPRSCSLMALSSSS